MIGDVPVYPTGCQRRLGALGEPARGFQRI
jgi:hypothetical protein